MFSHLTKDFFGNRLSLGIGMAFISLGLLFGSWATFIPFVKQKFDLDDAQLGLLLLSMPVGSITMNPVAAFLVHRFGMRNTTLFGLAFMICAFAVPLNAPNIYLVSLGMFLSGAGITITNVGMNTCVTSVEQHEKVNIMSTCHGMFSLGLMFGSLIASFARGLDVVPGYYMISVGILLFCLLFIIRPVILSIYDDHHEDESPRPKFSFPTGALLIMIIVSICINITEGSMADWTAVYMRDVVNTNPYFVGWGLSGYSLFMAFGRLAGDKIIPLFGSNKVLVYGGLLSISGIVTAVAFPYTASAIVGFALVGAGVSCGAPILYASAARVPNMAKGAGLALMNTFAMGGFLLGPVVIGFISDAISLPFAISILAVLGGFWVFYSNRVKLY
ncbi:MFS transporter [Emticicia sp. CRIBPO]|uniref:MFS transporter n=1 Tax=Emticicia sp. CRIBPO TaxID=2683258 RepID=UPI001411FFFD|nr:MFS transporter [Emticicia sp. CRIBPO]NBA86316.1 MFS transporter [Emticicia sp. CRIBPO]